MADPSKEDFLGNVAEHELTVVMDNGFHRHLTLKQPKTYNRHFHIVTWPGYLSISGDMGCFVFSRLADMFEFFRGTEINRGYWAEKLQADNPHSGHREFCLEYFREAITNDFAAWEFENAADRASAWAEIENEWNGLLGSPPTTTFEAVRRAMDYECPISKNRFVDFWEHNLEDYTYHFVWCCYAIQWAIQRYDDEKALVGRGLTTAEQNEQAQRCPCHGVDDLCPCQNVPDAKTIAARRAAKTSSSEEVAA